MGSEESRAVSDVSTPETVECASCGADLREHANTCPQCGADRDVEPGTPPAGGIAHDSASETGLSPSSSENGDDQWVYGVALTAAAWVPAAVLIALNVGTVTASALSLVAWIGLPCCLYFDVRYVRQASDWTLGTTKTAGWVLGAAIPLVGAIVGVLYLRRRREHLGASIISPSTI